MLCRWLDRCCTLGPFGEMHLRGHMCHVCAAKARVTLSCLKDVQLFMLVGSDLHAACYRHTPKRLVVDTQTNMSCTPLRLFKE